MKNARYNFRRLENRTTDHNLIKSTESLLRKKSVTHRKWKYLMYLF